MNDNRDAIDFGQDPVIQLFRRMFLPTLIGMVSMVVLNITDGAFVGHGVGSNALAVVNIVAPLFMIACGVGLMFGIGSSVVASIHLSKQKSHAANLNVTQGIMASFMTGAVIALFCLFFPQMTCRLFGCSDALLPYACDYLKWVAVVTPFNMVGTTGMFAVRLDGHPKFAMMMNCAMAMTNIVLDWLFIFPLEMGIEGAALATCTAFGLGNIPLLWFLFYKTTSISICRIRFTQTSLLLTIRNLLYQIKIGVSAFIGELALANVMVVGNHVFIDNLGEDGVAAFSVGCYCLPIVFMMGNAIVQSIQPVVSFAHGQGNFLRLRESARIAFITAAGSGIIGMLLMIFGAGLISSVFLSSDCNAYNICREGLPLYALAFFLIAITIVVVGYLQSIELATRATIYTLLRGFVFSIPSFIVLPKLIATNGLWLALALAEALTLLTIFSHYCICKMLHVTIQAHEY